MKKNDPECVKVVVRCRPMSRKEVEDNRQRIVEMDLKTGEIFVKNPEDPREPPKSFTFDQVYDWNSSQSMVFETTAQPIIDSVLQGYNGTVFAYGQTGTGKTHTMEGQWDPPEMRGIIPRAFCHIFERIEGTHDQNFLVRASFLEIYNEEVRDLLSKDPKNKLELKEDPDRGVYVKDLTYYVVKGVSEMENVLLSGKKNRSVGATLMNQDSSRSHSIFAVIIESSSDAVPPGGAAAAGGKGGGEKKIRAGKLNLVDLAGSERQSKTGATGDRLKEATKINLSLSALGNVISALVDAKGGAHVPYRDSKLTRLLQDSLGGNTKTVMVANMGPADYNLDETISTLRYANRAKNIKNKPKINEDPKDAMLREYQEEISKLRAMLEQQQQGGGAAPGRAPKARKPRPPRAARAASSAAAAAPEEEEEEEEEEGGGAEEEVRGMSNQQLDEVREALAAQKERLAAAENMREEERAQAEAELRRREETLARERRERERLAAQLRAMEEKLVTGHADAEEAARRERELAEAQIELERRRAEQEVLRRQLQEREEISAAQEEKFATIQEEVAAHTKKIKKLWAKYEEAQQELKEVQQENLNEKEDLLETIREQARQLKLLSLIADLFVPAEERQKLERRASWNDDAGEWALVQQSVLSESARRPVSALGAKRPSSAVARAAMRLAPDNSRFKGENILQLELEMPERTTRDYEERDLLADSDLLGMALPSNVHLHAPTVADSDDPRAARPSASRSASRPGSAMRSKPRPAAAAPPPAAPPPEDFPTARGLVAKR